MRRPATAVAAVVAVLAGLALVVVGAHSGTTRFEVLPTRSASPPPVRTPVPSVTATASPAPGPHNRVFVDFTYLLTGLVLLLVLFFVVLVFPQLRRLSLTRRGRNRRDAPAFDPDAPPVSRTVLVEAVGGGLRDVERGEPRDAVVACWVRLEEAAARAGTVRRPAETSADLTARVLAAHRVAPDPLRRLADLYREARYSRHALDERARAEARAALERIQSDLGAGHDAPASTLPAHGAGVDRPEPA